MWTILLDEVMVAVLQTWQREGSCCDLPPLASDDGGHRPRTRADDAPRCSRLVNADDLLLLASGARSVQRMYNDLVRACSPQVPVQATARVLLAGRFGANDSGATWGRGHDVVRAALGGGWRVPAHKCWCEAVALGRHRAVSWNFMTRRPDGTE